jgi:catechol 2,3-dioxygenase-like lactoylglutathione lyase family enzyme
MILGIDHILIAVDDLDLAVEVYQKLGFQVLRGGEHPNAGTYNALVPLADGTYLELIAVLDQAAAEQNAPFLLAALRNENRLAAFAVASDDLDADVAAIRARGLDIGDPRDGERLRPDGVRVAWRRAMPGDPRLPFLIQDVTPHDLRIPAPTFGIGQTLHLNDVNVGVIDVPQASELYKKLLGIEGEEGWFETPRGAIILKDVNTERILLLVLEADNPLDVINAWQGGEVQYEQQYIGGIGITLQPFDTLGAPMEITGRVG